MAASPVLDVMTAAIVVFSRLALKGSEDAHLPPSFISIIIESGAVG